MLLLSSSLVLAKGMMGVDYTPIGRGDLTFLQSPSSTELGLAENDGLIRPTFQPWIGFYSNKRPQSHQAELNILSHHIGTYYSESQKTVQRYQAVRVGYAFRRHWSPSQNPIEPFVRLGFHHNFSSVTFTSTAYTNEEAEDMEKASKEAAALFGGSGVTPGLGLRYPVQDHLFIGIRWDLDIHVTNFITEEGGAALDVYTNTNGAFLIEWQY